ncbi:MAG: hypothetical protein WEC15_06590 [Flavobacteriales bacterium]
MVRWILFLLLLFNGISAVVAGAMLAYTPDGTTMEMPLSWLDHSPFRSYRIPGLILFSVIGLGSLVAAALLLKPQKNSGRFPQMAGGALVVWILVQMIMLRTVLPIHISFLVIGVLIIVLGERMRRNA